MLFAVIEAKISERPEPVTAPDALWKADDLSESGAFVFSRFAKSERSQSE